MTPYSLNTRLFAFSLAFVTSLAALAPAAYAQQLNFQFVPLNLAPARPSGGSAPTAGLAGRPTGLTQPVTTTSLTLTPLVIPPTPAPSPKPDLNLGLKPNPPIIWIPPFKLPKPPKSKAGKQSERTVAVRRSDSQNQTQANQPFVFATQCGNGLCDANNRFEVVPGRGALYSIEGENSARLALGHMLIMAENIEVKVKAGRTTICVQPGSAVVAEVDPAGQTRVYGLTAYEKEHPCAIVEMEGDSFDPLPVQAGQMFNLTGRAMSDEELIAVDVLPLAPIEGGLSLAQRNAGIHLVRFSLKYMADDEFLLGCKRVTVPLSNKVKRLQEKLAASQEQPIPHHAPSSAMVAVSHKDVHTPPASMHLVETADYLVASSATALWESLPADKKLALYRGSLVVNAINAITIESGGVLVHAAAGSVLLVKAGDHALKVTNLSDRNKDAVSVSLDNNKLFILPAHELIVTSGVPSLGHVFDVHEVGHRSILSVGLGESDKWLTSSEVALVDEMRFNPLLVAMRAHSSKMAHKTIEQLTKTAAIVHMLKAGMGSYVRGEIGNDDDDVLGVSGCRSCH